MSKIKLIVPVLVLLILMIGGLVMCQNNSSNETNENKSAQDETEATTPKDFTEGVWIKKYPQNFACFKFETPDGLKVVTDPFLMNEVVAPDIVTESHQHGDHTDTSQLEGSFTQIAQTGEYDEKGIKIIGYSGHHDKGDTFETNIMYTYDINGIRIAHFGAQGDLPNDDILDKMNPVDVLLIQGSIKPEYGNSKLSLDEIKHIIDKINPKVIIPQHGSENMGKALAEYLKLKVEFVKDGQITVNRKELDTQKSILVLDLDIDVPKE